MRNDEFITKKISVLLHLSGNVSSARKVIKSLGRFTSPRFFLKKRGVSGGERSGGLVAEDRDY